MENKLTVEQLLDYLPQQKPFRFVDQILQVNEEQITGVYKFKEDEFFYAGHFPGKPITPGVILLESMCQVGVVAFGIYLLSLKTPVAEISNWLTLFADTEANFLKPVLPGEKVTIIAEKVFWRLMKLRAKITMYDQHNNIVAKAIASGVGVKKSNEK